MNSSSWIGLGYMNSCEFTTFKLKHNAEYWFKVTAPEYEKQAILHRAVKIETDGIVPQQSTNSGRLICTEVNGDYNCEFVIDDSFSIEDLFGNGYLYCDMLL